jgi:hypothetical protein
MKTLKLIICATLLTRWTLCAPAQGFVYDQQSSTDESSPVGSGSFNIQLESPFGQSFTPQLAGINFIRLIVADERLLNSLGATLFLTLHDGSFSGPVLGITPQVVLPRDYRGTVNFFFSDLIPLTPGNLYVFEVSITLGSDSFGIRAGEYGYAGGDSIFNGTPNTGGDLWFREGIYTVPEPSVFALTAFGLGLFWFHRRKT